MAESLSDHDLGSASSDEAVWMPSEEEGASAKEEPDGYLDHAEFIPTMIILTGRNDFGEFVSIPAFKYPSESSRPVTEEFVLELHALPGKSIIDIRMVNTLVTPH